MQKVVWILALLLLVLHQDFWAWSDRTLVLGFLPIGLAYHLVFSLAAAGLWLAAVKLAWPSEIEAWADAVDEPDGATGANDAGSSPSGGATR